MSKVSCIQADWQQDVSAIAGLNAGGGAADSIATLIKDSFDIITDAEDTISRYDSDGEINSVFDTDSVGKYQLASFPTLTETLHKYSKNAPISIQNDIDLPFNMKLDDFLGAMSNVDIKGYSTAATGSLAKSGDFSTGQSGIVTLKDLLEPATPLGKQLKREYIEFKKQIGDDFTYEEYQMMAMNLASYDYDSFVEALVKGTVAFALTVAVTSIPVIGPIISLGMSGVGALEGFWGAATGNSLLTGRKLSDEEKVLSGLFGAMNLAFAGLTAYNSFFKGKVKIPSKKASETTRPQTMEEFLKEMNELPRARLSQKVEDGIVSTPNGKRLDPSVYMSKAEIEAHLSLFDDGVVRVQSKENFDFAINNYGPNIGDPKTGTYVMPKSVADKAIKVADGNPRILEELLGLEPMSLGKNPVLLDIKKTTNMRVPSGNESGAWQGLWEPGGFTNGGIPEVVVDTIKSNDYIVKNVFN